MTPELTLVNPRLRSQLTTNATADQDPHTPLDGTGKLVDNRQVVLLKSRRTNNRFYTLVGPSSGYRNADTIDDFPPDWPLGIAYPCLEDGLNDFAVIRTTFETIEMFKDDPELRREMMGIIQDSRANLVLRLTELRDRIARRQAHFLGTDLQEFKDHVLHMSTRGSIRRQLDNMMKVDVFESVSKAESLLTGGSQDAMYRYEHLPQHALSKTEHLEPRAFVSILFDDILDAVRTDPNYQSKYTFDRHVFQKFIAVMFVNYATTDPMYYGTQREDYGVSGDRDMTATPLYQAVARALRELERESLEIPRFVPPGADDATIPSDEDLQAIFEEGAEDQGLFGRDFSDAAHTVSIPFGAAEHMLMEPLAVLAEAIRLLEHVDHPRSLEVRTMARSAAQQIFQGLKELQIISPLASDPNDGP